MKTIIGISTLTLVVMLVSLPVVGQTVVSNQAEETSTEVNGVEFEIVVGEREWIIPEQEVPPRFAPIVRDYLSHNFDSASFPDRVEALLPPPETVFPVSVSLRITNNTTDIIRLHPFDPGMRVFFRLFNNEGEMLVYEGGRQILAHILLTRPYQIYCPTLLPGSSIEFDFNISLFRRGGDIYLGGSDGLGGAYYFRGIQPGTHQIQIFYIGSGVSSCHDLNRMDKPGYSPEIAVDLWRGELATPKIRVHIVERGDNEQ